MRLYFSDTDLQCRIAAGDAGCESTERAVVTELPVRHRGARTTSGLRLVEREANRDGRHMRLLQFCNVGNVCGGTAACAWTITRALPHWTHVVLFPRRPTEETANAFAHCRVSLFDSASIAELPARWQPDILLLHNTHPGRVPPCEDVFTVQYVHSAGSRTLADVTVVCSHWLAGQVETEQGRPPVLWQPVPIPPTCSGRSRSDGRRLRVGRLCTPTPVKWPECLVSFYAELAATRPEIDWEFVGCPDAMKSAMTEAVGGRVRFWPAGWTARSLLHTWDAVLYHHPTLTESFGRVVAESMRCGCIPIVDRRGGFCEQIEPETGFLCDRPQEFADALDRLRDRAAREEMKAAARQCAEERFSLRAFAQRWGKLLRESLGSSRRTAVER
ncbi:D-inositol 3-phosphate glycosyltransferase (N-acetylglucosamine-inositol-phosphate N-acetylglucosaminyltransferase) (GlcNAc-Ins-P N-acetylglucosaminyltransferase) [Durusdinium trenchii]|uniref:D-inositol 3-phosphate glycosyltransferase (N-acetylglucosamine-inositol-phosphate N-acetylglucosaminyltransferase) (GlcNAc-Ins-P N-acetylglucosaminyltransferase) n=1 Tax=Durusdinium trenchii TaxID=1381693 RepID=A0ABP0K1X9_9DINO